MQRRDFLRASGLAGAVLLAPGARALALDPSSLAVHVPNDAA